MTCQYGAAFAFIPLLHASCSTASHPMTALWVSRAEGISGEIYDEARGGTFRDENRGEARGDGILDENDVIPGETHGEETPGEISADEVPDQVPDGRILSGTPAENFRDDENHRGNPADESCDGSWGAEFLYRQSRDDHENRGYHEKDPTLRPCQSHPVPFRRSTNQSTIPSIILLHNDSPPILSINKRYQTNVIRSIGQPAR